jgi:hypothetical protein
MAQSFWEYVFGERPFRNSSIFFDKVNIKCPCGASFVLREGLETASFATAAEKFVEAHKEHGVRK